MTDLVRHLGVSIRRLRRARAWSQERLAGQAGLNRSYVGELERGTVIASIVTVDKLARAFAVDIDQLLGAARASGARAGAYPGTERAERP